MEAPYKMNEDYQWVSKPDWWKLVNEIEKFYEANLLHRMSLSSLENSRQYDECVRESQKSPLSVEDFYCIALRVDFDYEKAHQLAVEEYKKRKITFNNET